MARIQRKIDLKFILDLYDAFLRTPDLNKVSEALDIPASNGILCDWLKKNPDLKLAKDLADERRSKSDTLPKFILGRLSPEAKKIWSDIQFWGDGEIPEKVTAKLSQNLRKELFICAMLHNSYNISRSCEMVGINRATMQSWTTLDPEFALLMKEIQIHKKDFFENALMDLVEARYPGAVLFVNRTINADRGYSEKMVIQHQGQVGTGIDIDSLDLDLDTRRKILEAVRKQKQLASTQPATVTDIEAKMLPAPAEETVEE